MSPPQQPPPEPETVDVELYSPHMEYLGIVHIPRIQAMVMKFCACFILAKSEPVNIPANIPADFRIFFLEEREECEALNDRCESWLQEVQGQGYNRYVLLDPDFFPVRLPNLVLPNLVLPF